MTCGESGLSTSTFPLRLSAMTDPAIIDIEGASFHAGGTKILSEISWQVHAHQHWAVVGPNGCGKTTLLRLAAGYIWPNAGGTVRRCGREKIDLRQLRRFIGWVNNAVTANIPKEERVLDTVVSGKFAQIGLQELAWDPPTDADYGRAFELLELLECDDLADQRFGILSQGEQQKVLVTRARMAEPLLMVLDEPCDGMDPGARERFLSGLENLINSDDAPTVVLVTHHIEQIIPGIQNTLIMSRGRIEKVGPTSQVLTPEKLSAVYGVPVRRVISEDGRLWPLWR